MAVASCGDFLAAPQLTVVTSTPGEHAPVDWCWINISAEVSLENRAFHAFFSEERVKSAGYANAKKKRRKNIYTLVNRGYFGRGHIRAKEAS